MKTRSLTVSLSMEEHEMLQQMVEHFQKQTFAKVSKSDVAKHLIRAYWENLKEQKEEEA